jgi:hypothetical protein
MPCSRTVWISPKRTANGKKTPLASVLATRLPFQDGRQPTRIRPLLWGNLVNHTAAKRFA